MYLFARSFHKMTLVYMASKGTLSLIRSRGLKIYIYLSLCLVTSECSRVFTFHDKSLHKVVQYCIETINRAILIVHAIH